MTTLERAESESLQAMVLLHLGDARRLVDIATDYLVLGIDTPSLRDLAGLDLARPVDPYDARDLFWAVLDELGLDRLPVDQAGQFASYAYALLTISGAVSPRAATRLFYQLAVNLDYQAEPSEIMSLFGLDDMWDLGFQTEDQTRTEVLDTARSLVADHEAQHDSLDRESLARIAQLAGTTRP